MKDMVLKYLETQYDALDIIHINDALGLSTAQELRELQETLIDLENEFVVYKTKKNKYILYAHCANFRTGIIDVNKKGFGFLIQTDGPDIHIAKDYLNYALDKDMVLVEVISKDIENPEGKVIKILKRDLKNIVGIIKSDGYKIYFEPHDKRNIELDIDEASLEKCVEGEVVVISLDESLGKNRYKAHVSQHVCHKDDAHQDILLIAANYDIFHEFPSDAMEQAEKMPTSVLPEDYAGRQDLTAKMIFTIDGADTHDVDDAVSLEIQNGLYHLGVHIADVSYYVTENSPLDEEALRRGTSSYLAGSVIPQLPHKLSNGICSLNPNVSRCAISLMMTIDNRGKVLDYDIFPSIIESKKKMTYTAVNHILMDNVIDEGYEPFADNLRLMNELAHIIRAERTNRGASDFDIDEAKIICDENGAVQDIQIRERGEGERLIEDFMIVANETVANIFETQDLPGIYRVHEVPRPEKIQQFINFCSITGHPIKGKFKNINPKTYQKMLAQIDVTGEEGNIYRALAVRSMPKAFYSSNNIGHFGLASMHYLHFTSPIRRYPDLETHRLLRKFIFNNERDLSTITYYQNNLEAIARQSSEREVKAVEAEREVDKMKMAEYMEKHIGEEYDAIISGVVGFGIFVQLTKNLIEGLIPITSLSGDYYEYIEDLQSLIGKKTKKRYTIGQPIKVRCVGASKLESQVDFEEIKATGDKNDRNQ